ncbi:MAG: hypothetical protein VXX04_06650 [Actinomycetota bacterium]|nr:hypothetical protein [Actinomycetota bacterium]
MPSASSLGDHSSSSRRARTDPRTTASAEQVRVEVGEVVERVSSHVSKVLSTLACVLLVAAGTGVGIWASLR